jgi:hypothetical protein
MVELSTREEPPALRHKPSRLRHEVRIESNDDERAAVKDHSVQEPDSQLAIPETQPLADSNPSNDRQSTYGETELSPNAAATLQRLAVKKGPEAGMSSFAVRLLSKEAFGVDPDSSPFQFHSAKNATTNSQSEKVACVTAATNYPLKDQAVKSELSPYGVLASLNTFSLYSHQSCSGGYRAYIRLQKVSTFPIEG